MTFMRRHWYSILHYTRHEQNYSPGLMLHPTDLLWEFCLIYLRLRWQNPHVQQCSYQSPRKIICVSHSGHIYNPPLPKGKNNSFPILPKFFGTIWIKFGREDLLVMPRTKCEFPESRLSEKHTLVKDIN